VSIRQNDNIKATPTERRRESVVNFEKLRKHVLNTNKLNPGGNIHYHLMNLATQFGLTKAHLEEVLLEMKNSGLIDVSFDNGFGVVTLKARGAEVFPKSQLALESILEVRL
jgi:hypothetical protein